MNPVGRKVFGEPPEVFFANKRYEVIGDILNRSMKLEQKKLTISDMLDKVMLDKYLGIPIFLVLMWATFQFAYVVSEPFMGILEEFFIGLGGLIAGYIANERLASFVGDGIFGGLGYIMVFVPNIMFIFFALSLLEASGYLSRAAFVMDRVMVRLGLHGRSFIPMLMGFGCNVPAIMATRTMDNFKDRLITIMVTPLMSCSARLPVYVLIGGALFPGFAGTAMFLMYVLGIVLAIGMALLFRRFLFRGVPSPFLMELPVYQMPTLRSAVMDMWNKGAIFLKKAGTVLLFGAIILWFMSTHPWEATEGGELIENSYAAALGHGLEYVFAPLGFDWKDSVALFFGFLAKEVVVEAMGILYGVGIEEEAVAAAVAGAMTPLTGFAFMAFVLIYMPCLATLGTIRVETGSWKWTGVVVAYGLVLAYLTAFAIITIGGALGFS
ncbi:ferrous iron transport protein B [Candidatus Pyrohabitans sp.]